MRTARLLPSVRHCYPSIDPTRWYRVTGEDASVPGCWLEDAGGDPFLTGGRRFVWAGHLEVREA